MNVAGLVIAIVSDNEIFHGDPAELKPPRTPQFPQHRTSMEFERRNAFVTGAAKGIGLATATILASRGANVALADLRLDAVEKAAKSIAEQ